MVASVLLIFWIESCLRISLRIRVWKAEYKKPELQWCFDVLVLPNSLFPDWMRCLDSSWLSLSLLSSRDTRPRWNTLRRVVRVCQIFIHSHFESRSFVCPRDYLASKPNAHALIGLMMRSKDNRAVVILFFWYLAHHGGACRYVLEVWTRYLLPMFPPSHWHSGTRNITGTENRKLVLLSPF